MNTFRTARLEYQLASGGKTLMDIEEIRKELLALTPNPRTVKVWGWT